MLFHFGLPNTAHDTYKKEPWGPWVDLPALQKCAYFAVSGSAWTKIWVEMDLAEQRFPHAFALKRSPTLYTRATSTSAVPVNIDAPAKI